MQNQTDLKQVKRVSKILLFTEIHNTDLSPMIVQHPFTSTGITLVSLNPNQILDITKSQDNLEKWRNFMLNEFERAKNITDIYKLVNKPYCLTFLKFALPYLSSEDFSRLLADAWIRSENPNMDPNISKRQMLSMFSKADANYLMEESERKQIEELDEEDLIILNAVKNKVINGNEDELISIKDMINLTYGLEKVGVISNVGDYKAIGEFLIENELIDEITNLPENLLRLLDKEKLGLEYMQQTGGVIVGTTFVYADEYKFNEIYDGKTLPQIPEIADFVFKLEITATPVTDVSEVEDSAEWIKLPIDNKEAHRIATGHGAERIEDCVYLGFESIIPQISAEDFGDMEKFIELNKLAGVIKIMTDYDQAKFKAILQSEEPQCIEKMLDIAQNLGSYEFAPKIDGAGNYYKEYISHFLDPHIDRAWVESLLTRNEGRDLMQRLGADETNYGFISTRGQSLFEYVSRYGNPIPLNEEFELIEVCGQTALFTNGRIRPEDVSHNLYRYDLRESEDGGFCSIEKNVLVNHGGTVLTKAPIDLNSDGVLTFNEETSPNFLGEDITLRKFLETDFTQQETDGIKIGDIK